KEDDVKDTGTARAQSLARAATRETLAAEESIRYAEQTAPAPTTTGRKVPTSSARYIRSFTSMDSPPHRTAYLSRTGGAMSRASAHERLENLAELVAGAVEQTLGRLGRHVEFSGHLGVGAVVELVQLQRGALPAGQLGDRGTDH